MKNKGKQRQYLFTRRRAIRTGKLEYKKRLRHRAFGGINTAEPDTAFMPIGYSHKVLKHLKEANFELLEYINGSVATVRLPRVFSISENPEETIRTLRRLYTVGKKERVGKIVFNYDDCEQMGLSASTIMDVIVLALEQFRNENYLDWELEGNFPKREDVRTMLCASGLLYHLKIDTPWRDVDGDRIKRFQTVSGEGNGKTGKSSATATGLARYFSECLKTQHLELTDNGKRLLSGILGEVLDNCESHGGTGSTWYTQGHYQLVKGNEFGEMQLLFLSLGDSIYEGLKNDSSRETQQRLDFIKQNSKYKISNKNDEEILYTVCALQEGISRLRDKNKPGYAGRGSGTVRMIQFFEDIGETEATNVEQQLTIVSGNVFLSFDKRYKMDTVSFEEDLAFGSGDKKIIAFNKDNDIYNKPDKSCVRRIDERFPGTIISLKFYLDERYIRQQSRLGE